MQLYQGEPRQGDGPTGEAGMAATPAPFPVLLRVPYFPEHEPVRVPPKKPATPPVNYLDPSSPPPVRAPRKTTAKQESPPVVEAPTAPQPVVEAAQKPPAPVVRTRVRTRRPRRRVKLAAGLFVLVMVGLSAHWHWASMVPESWMEILNGTATTEMIILPAEDVPPVAEPPLAPPPLEPVAEVPPLMTPPASEAVSQAVEPSCTHCEHHRSCERRTVGDPMLEPPPPAPRASVEAAVLRPAEPAKETSVAKPVEPAAEIQRAEFIPESNNDRDPTPVPPMDNAPVATAPAATEELPPVEAELGPDILPIEEGTTP